METYICDKCKKFGFVFERKYKPEEFIEGYNPGRTTVWIIGINPKGKNSLFKDRTDSDLSNYFLGTIHRYFNVFKKISPTLFNGLGKTVAHTDIIKCASENDPAEPEIYSNCISYLIQQIKTYKPRMIICNGAIASREIKKYLPVYKDYDTYYYSNFDNSLIGIILTGFMGRTDDFSKRRLGKEIEMVAKELNIHL